MQSGNTATRFFWDRYHCTTRITQMRFYQSTFSLFLEHLRIFQFHYCNYIVGASTYVSFPQIKLEIFDLHIAKTFLVIIPAVFSGSIKPIHALTLIIACQKVVHVIGKKSQNTNRYISFVRSSHPWITLTESCIFWIITIRIFTACMYLRFTFINYFWFISYWSIDVNQNKNQNSWKLRIIVIKDGAGVTASRWSDTADYLRWS